LKTVATELRQRFESLFALLIQRYSLGFRC
jgi:hypothetical protein